MCEWLSCAEWCDVQIHCSGRTLNAHRAVLASVSPFLKNLLLSSPSDEIPTFIVLPDFDFEAMSSVLNYIYNGEVIVNRHKLHMFLDITRALQVFVDEQWLTKIDHSLETLGSSESADNDRFEPMKYGIPPYINIKKLEQTQDILQLISPTALDLRDKHTKRARFWDWSAQCNASLGNPQLPYEDRQRYSYLRDLFIETYPWNGNANGGTSGVPAISNGRYRGLTSASLTNANYNHPAVAGSEKTNVLHLSTFPFPSPNRHTDLSRKESHSRNNYSLQYRGESNTKFERYQPEFSFCASQFPASIGRCEEFAKFSTFSTDKLESIHKHRTSDNQKQHLLPPDQNKLSSESKSLQVQNPSSSKSSKDTTIRVAISNKVLESPWCPHPPKHYKPFRRKLPSQTTTANNINTKVSFIEENDSNNNVQEVDQINTIAEETLSKDSKDKDPCKILHTAECALKSNICNQDFPSNESLTCHTKSDTTSRYTCNECSKSFSQLRNYKYHMSVHRGTREFAATCTVCGKYFNDRGYLSSHMKIHRNRKEYKCTQCPKSFNQRVAYNMHVRIHTGLKPHVCEQCGKAFSRKMLLKQHQRTHSGERPYACAHCPKRFADRSNMTLHLRLHTGVKPFSCTLCPKSFTKKHHLKSHLNFHTGAKPYSCPRCKLAFTQSSNMRTHYKKCNVLLDSCESVPQAHDTK